MSDLTQEQRADIECAYESARMVDATESARRGEHAILIALLQRYGLPAGDIVEAYATCERVLYG